MACYSINLISVRLKPAINSNASVPSQAGRKPLAASLTDVSFQAYRSQCDRERCRRGDNPRLGIGGDRIGEHRNRSEDGYTGDCIGNVFVIGMGDEPA
jgi:hypothetical protein